MEKTCDRCGIKFEAKWSRCRFCSKSCKDRYHRDRPGPTHSRICNHCGSEYRSYDKDRMYCSKTCSRYAYHLHRPSRREKRSCAHCGAEFTAYMSNARKYCSYKCHIDSGGSLRAGLAAAAAKVRYGAKKDANHGEVVAALEVAGAMVLDISHMGCGMPDLIVSDGEHLRFVEIKNPRTSYGRRGLNKRQQAWAVPMAERHPVHVVRSPEEAVEKLNAWRLERGRPK